MNLFTVDHKVRFLKDPGNYPSTPSGIEAKETHMSWIFLTDKYAYKLKKPVKYSFLDFSTVELRRENAQREVDLNSRLSPQTYIGVVPLTLREEDKLMLDGEDKPVDYLVKMHRLPEERMLDHLIEKSRVEPGLVKEAASRLIRFYADSQSEKIGGETYFARIREELLENFSELNRLKAFYSNELIHRNFDSLSESLDYLSELIRSRADNGRILEGHGDLKPDHICLVDEPVIFDCLEFNKKLRTVDPLDEFAYLEIECAQKGNANIAGIFIEMYCNRLNDRCHDPLYHFYKAKRAWLRSRLATAHLEEDQYSRKRKWIEKTDWYLKKCRVELEELQN